MTDSPPVEGNRRWFEVMRWLCVLPVAYFASWLFRGIVVFLLASLGVELRGTEYPAFLFPLLQTLPSGCAFTFLGALTAPRRRPTAAMVLAAFWILMSLVIHIIGQSSPGLTNYMHATGESLGAVIGVVIISRRRQVVP
jgi:hypothetical protein